MPSSRRYDDPCGIARALDIIGDRWALLVVRELIFGPKRFLQLRDGLHGLSLGRGRWGSRESVSPPAELSVNALLLALETVFDPAAAGSDATFALRVDGDWFRLTVAGDSIEITRARTELPTVTFETDVATLRSVAFGREPVSDAERDGRLTVTGDRQAAEHFARMFAVPEARPFR